ncbi:MAG: lactoylglutathione lyase [Rubrivivax sp.]|nr:MAG: lactoylglutathione lyase [Rubrivivax sp.]
MKYLHAMIRVADPQASLRFYQDLLGLVLLRRKDSEKGRFTLYYLASAEGEPEIELTHNWDGGEYIGGNAFGHLAFRVADVHAACQRLADGGVTILRPPRDGHMAFVKDPSGVSIELLQAGPALAPIEPWASMPSTGTW